MSKQKKLSRWGFGLTAALLAGIAMWYFRAKPFVSQAVPLAEVQSEASVATPSEMLIVAPPEVSAAVHPTPVATPASSRTVSPAIQGGAPVLTQLASSGAGQPAADLPPPYTSDFKPQIQDEIAATARMYAAHNSLRTPEVADPDSKANKQILQIMVLKALSQPANPSPIVSSRGGQQSKRALSSP